MDNLLKYCLRLGDNSLILSHRLEEYSSNGPFLEEDLAITNVALDHLGQAEAFYTYATEIEGKGRSEDDLAYKRQEHEYYNVQLVEQPNTDFAYIIARQFFMDAYNFYLYSELKNSADPRLAGLAAKSLKEATYHLKRSSAWLMCPGDGSDESHERAQEAIDNLWMYTGELFEIDEADTTLLSKNVIPDSNHVKELWEICVNETFENAKLTHPENDYMITGSRQGVHAAYLGHILAEMQYLYRTFPEATW